MFEFIFFFVVTIVVISFIVSVHQPTLSDDERAARRERNERGVL